MWNIAKERGFDSRFVIAESHKKYEKAQQTSRGDAKDRAPDLNVRHYHSKKSFTISER